MELSASTFSPNGEYFLYTSPDGVLKLWETDTGLLKQEYTPSSHLSATCSCLSWGPTRRSSETPRKRKKRKSGSDSVAFEEIELVAIGTTSGAILLYSVAKGDLHSQLIGGHSDTVNDICWQTDSSRLYSCSSDHHIAEWDVLTTKIQQKWKADKGPVHSICRCSSTHLLSAGRSIKLWDLHTKDVIKIFTGHATEVFRLLHIHPHTEDGEATQSIENTYFLSAAANDRLIQTWQIKTSSKDKNSLVSFSIPDEPIMLDVNRPDSKDRPLLLAVVTKGGQVLMFEHELNGKLKRPLHPKVTMQIASGGSKGEIPRPIPVLAAHICDDADRNILLVYGNFLKPVFEKQMYNASQADVCLVREDPSRLLLKTEASVTKVKTPGVSKDVTVLVPGQMAPTAPSQNVAKRKKRKASVGEMTMEERLDAISIDKPSSQSGATQPPKADTLARLLTQGLQSHDKKILNNVLQNTNEQIIRNTVQRLPVQVIIPLVQELTKRMHGHAQSGHTLVKWIKILLTVHTSYLLTFPEIIETFSSLYQMMDSRVSMFSRLSRLQGKLDIMLSQISSQDQEEETGTSQQALLQYQEESSDDELEDIAVGPGYSESEDNWEDLSSESDMEVQDDVDSKG